MVKFMGAALVLLAAGLLGMKKYSDFYERKRALSLMYEGAAKMESTLESMCLPLDECFYISGGFFEKAAKNMSCGLMPKDAVIKAARENGSLKKEDMEIVEKFAYGLSAASCTGQIQNLSLFIKELEGNVKSAQKDVSTKAALCVKGSILAAAALILMMI